MSRRKGDGDEFGSLELLLDTICNMFGLFIFVGMLTALLASARSTQIRSESTPGAVVADPLAADRQAVERLRERVERAEAEAVPDARFDQARGKLAALQARNEELDRRTRTLEKLLQEGGSRLEANVAELPRLRAEVQRLEAQVRAQAATEGVRLRAPRKRSVEGLMPVQVILWKDRVYWINPWIGRLDAPCEAWSEWNPDAVDMGRGPQCEIRECFRGGGQWLIRSVPLRADGGLDAAEGAEAWRAPFATLLARLRDDRHVVSLKVAPDAHGAFQRVREAVAGAGFSYDVSPIRIEDGTYRDEIRDGIATAQ
jgi:hypothetical protein